MEKPSQKEPVIEPRVQQPSAGPDAGSDATDSESLDELISRAKRAHDLVEAVDLEKVAAHDASEVDKLSHVANALDEIAQGREVEHVEGVDEVMPVLDANQQRIAALLEHLSNAGYADRLGLLLYAAGADTSRRPQNIVPHVEGLPAFDTCVAPEACVGSGYFGLFVSESGVFAAGVNEPVTKHHWRIYRSRPYDNLAELSQIISQFSLSAFE